MEAITQLWQRFEAWLGSHAPTLLGSLRPGATEEQIAAAEAFLSVKFPDDFKNIYRVHNGQVGGSEGLIAGSRLLSLEHIQSIWKVWEDLQLEGAFVGYSAEPGDGVRNEWWNPRWIPVTDDETGNHECLDLNPAEGGQSGQIIEFWHDEGRRTVEAPDIGFWFDSYVTACEAGRFAYSEEYGAIVDVEDL